MTGRQTPPFWPQDADDEACVVILLVTLILLGVGLWTAL